MKLLGIDPSRAGGLLFRFDDNGVAREWAFESASMAEFIALLLGGSIRDGQEVVLPSAALELVSQAGCKAKLRAQLAKIDFALPQSDDQLRRLRQAIDLVLARRGGQPSGATPTRTEQMNAGLARPAMPPIRPK